MKYIIYIFTILLSFAFSSKIIDETNLKIKKAIPDFKKIEHKMFNLKSSYKETKKVVNQKFFRDEVNTWKIQKDDSTYYYAVLDNVIGKAMPITFLVIFNQKGKVFETSIIKYREPYGGEVKSKKWLNQFSQYTDTSNYKIGDGIYAISGATLSVHSVSKGVHKLALIINHIIKNFDGE
ncbi:MAG: hypothetical protein CMG66_00675 [Candidatus Marinimicrobia bacterium]|nr:hypothetical protein [Candidatus Neomarinimicrobiota bacterium]|tara:strand:+ start:15862 stop:16398 length:537 start_codon:yes stop_codon:yes gene_type:complete